MAGVNRYDQATPARDNYFNTFVPLPLDQLTALGMARQDELKRNQAMLDKAYNDMLDIKYIKDSPFEEQHYRDIRSSMDDIASRYATMDLTNSSIQSQLRREMASKIDPTMVNRLEESYNQWAQAQALKADLKSKGMYNEYLDEDPARNWDSQTNGVYGYLPEAYQGREKLLGPYLDNLPETFLGIDEKTGTMQHGVTAGTVKSIANERAAELLSTPAGRQEVKLFKKIYGSAADGKSDVDIMRLIMEDYGRKEIHTIASTLPQHYLEAFGSDADKSRMVRPMRNLDRSSIKTFTSITDVEKEMSDMKEKGDVEGAKDLQYALEDADKKYNIKKISNRYYDELASNPKALAKTGIAGAIPMNDYNEADRTTIKKAMNEISSTVGRRYAFGFTAEQLAAATDKDGKKLGLNDFETLSSDILTQPLNYEIVDINGSGRPKDNKFADKLSGMSTKELDNVSIDIMPNEEREYRPVITLGYSNTKEGKTAHNVVKVAINDETQKSLLADMMYTRGNYEGAAATMNAEAMQVIMNDNLDTPKTYKIITPDGGQNFVSVKRDPIRRSSFIVSFNGRNPSTGETSVQEIPVGTRQEVVAEIYNVLGQNIGNYKGYPVYSRFAKINE